MHEVPLDEGMTRLERVARKLVRLSRADSYDPFTELEWPTAILGLWMAPEFMSVYETPLQGELDERTWRELNKWECTNFFSLNVNGIRDLLVALTQRLHTPGFEFVSEYMHCFIAEENEHMWYFSKFCNDYAGKVYADRSISGFDAPEPDIDNFLVFARVLVFEELVDIYNRKMSKDERLDPFAQEINRLHHLDEVRHIAYGRLYVEAAFHQLQDKYPEDQLDEVRDAVERFIRLTVVRLYSVDAYRDAGLQKPVKMRNRLLRHPARIEYNRNLSQAIAKHFVNAGILPAERPVYS